MPDSNLGPYCSIYIYKWDITLRQLAQQNDRHFLAMQADDFHIIPSRSGKDDPIHMVLTDQTRIAISITWLDLLEQDMKALFEGSLFHAKNDARQERICKHLFGRLA